MSPPDPLPTPWRSERELGGALADAFLAAPAWAPRALLLAALAVLDARPAWLEALVREVLATCPRPPVDRRRELAAVVALALVGHRVEDAVRGGHPRVRRRVVAPVAMGRVRFGVPELATPGDLGDWLGLDAAQLAWFADVRSLERSARNGRLRHYSYRWSSREAAPARVLEAPKSRLKALQRRVLHELLDLVPQHPAAHGFVPGRSQRTHAALHASRGVVVRVDLEDFFAHVTAARVYGCFRAVGYPEGTAHALTGLCTNAMPPRIWSLVPRPAEPAAIARHHRLGRHLAGPHLPQGAPTSPALAGLAAWGLDVRVAALAEAHGATCSRYADDLVLSGDRRLAVGPLLDALATIAREEGMRLNPRKTHVRRSGARQVVGGAVVNVRPAVAREERDRLRALLHDAARNGAQAANRAGVPDLRAHVLGRIAWVEALHPPHGRRLREQLDAIAW